MGARAVMAGVRLRVFDTLADEPADSAAVAARTGLSVEGADTLLVALRSLGYVRASGLVYDVWDQWSEVESALRPGPRLGLHDRAPGDPYWGAT